MSVAQTRKKGVDSSQHAYTHGLEEIYAIEKVDVSSIRKLAKEPEKKHKKTPKQPKKQTSDAQLLLELGDFYRGRMESFILHEPIQVLGLSMHAEKKMQGYEIQTIQHLIQKRGELQGLGQSFSEEIDSKLQDYLSGKDLYQTDQIDFRSLLRALMIGIDQKKVHLALKHYSLEFLFPLKPTEKGEVMRLDAKGKKAWMEEIVISEKRLKKYLNKIFNALVNPWIVRRGGIASYEEIEDRLMEISHDAEETLLILSFLEKIIEKPLTKLIEKLIPIDNELYAVDQSTSTSYDQLIRFAATYFYRPSVNYLFVDFIQFLVREMALYWIGYPKKWIKKLLILSPQFRVFKGKSKKLEIKLA